MAKIKAVRKIFRVLAGTLLIFCLLLVVVFFAVKWGWTNVKGVIDPKSSEFASNRPSVPDHPLWSQGEEWQTLAAALVKDRDVINRAATGANIPARLIVAMIVPEQLRLYYSEREIFKQIFAPLKILGSQTQFSWGVAGLKQETAKEIEARDTAHLLDFTTANHDEERFNRLVNEHDHYYSYLYTGLYLKQVMRQWKQAGFPIVDRPEILGTLFNIGFAHSEPKPHPEVGGAEIEIAGTTYTFGALTYEFYYSNELLTEFPR